MNILDRFRRLTREALRLIIDEHSLVEADAKTHLPDMWVLYRNATSQVAVHFEYCSDLWVTIGRQATHDGQPIGGEQYNLDVLLSLRAPELELGVHRLDDFEEGRIEPILANRAVALRYADDVLRGNFEIFPELARITEERFQRRLEEIGGQFGI